MKIRTLRALAMRTAARGEIVNITKVGKATAWKDVPTPAL
jgi:hypothetical protein